MTNLENPHRTNLLGHQHLLEWYRSAQALGDRIICPLVAKIPGLHGARTLPCDCPDSRKHFLALRPECCHEGRCLPREFWNWPNSLVGNELQEYYKRQSAGR